MSTPLTQERQEVSEVQVKQGYWQAEQEVPERYVAEGQLVRHELFAE